MFFSISSVRMQSIYKMHGPLRPTLGPKVGKIYPRFVSCLSEKLTDVQIDDVISGKFPKSGTFPLAVLM